MKTNYQGILGAFAFYWHHYRSERERLKMERLRSLAEKFGFYYKSPYYSGNFPEASRVYLVLCERYGIEPEWA